MSSTIVFITGANSGIGLETAKVIASTSPDFHVIIASRSLENANSAKADIEAAEGTKGLLSTVQLDVTDESSIEQAATFVEQKFGRLDVLVNNAGVSSRDPDAKTRFQQCFETNAIGPALVSTAFRPLLLKSQSPYSIYLSSVVGSLALVSDPNSFVSKLSKPPKGQEYLEYQASKAALNMVAIQESVASRSTALKVFAVCPGFVRSNIRGKSEGEVSGWGQAKDPQVSGKLILSIIQGERDMDVNTFIHEKGVYPW